MQLVGEPSEYMAAHVFPPVIFFTVWYGLVFSVSSTQSTRLQVRASEVNLEFRYTSVQWLPIYYITCLRVPLREKGEVGRRGWGEEGRVITSSSYPEWWWFLILVVATWAAHQRLTRRSGGDGGGGWSGWDKVEQDRCVWRKEGLECVVSERPYFLHEKLDTSFTFKTIGLVGFFDAD